MRIRKFRFCLAMLAITVLPLSACTSMDSQANAAAKDVMGQGYQCLLVPTSFSGPGSIFEVTPQGVRYDIVDLEELEQVQVARKPAGFGTVSRNADLSNKLTIGLLKTAIPNLTASIDTEASRNKSAVIEFGDLLEERTDSDADLAAASWFNRALAENELALREGSRYFLVRDAYSAGRIKYDISNALVTSLGGEAVLTNELSAKGTLFRGSGGANYKMDQKFEPRLRVCIKSREILLSAGAGGGRNAEVSRSDAVIPELAFE